MKKFLVLTMMIATIKAFGIFGFGIHAGVDQVNVPEKSIPAFSFDIAGNSYSYEITRSEISNPFVFGGQLYFDLPLVPIGFEADFEGSWASYNLTAPAELTDNVGTNNIPLSFAGYDVGATGYEDEEMSFGRISADLSVKWYVFGFPPVVKIFSFYVGGGTGFHFITPLVSKEFIMIELQKETTIPTSPTEVDIEDLAEFTMGYHILTGFRIKPPVIPIAFNIDYKYTRTKKNDYGDDTNNFGLIKGSLSIYF